jgi:omega-6 fatty acid desaturase (delta-12 desaturase)
LLFSVLAAMLMVRAFITYHDYMHRAILARSRAAWVLFRVYSALALTPPRSWKKSHNYHHGHVGQISSSSIGAFPIITTQMWHEASWHERTSYRIIRHPLTVLAGYVTIFLFSVTLLPLLTNPLRHWDSLLVLAGHAALIAVLWVFGGFVRRLGAGQLSFLCPAQLQAHAHSIAGFLELLSSRHGIVQLHASQ